MSVICETCTRVRDRKINNPLKVRVHGVKRVERLSWAHGLSLLMLLPCWRKWPITGLHTYCWTFVHWMTVHQMLAMCACTLCEWSLSVLWQQWFQQQLQWRVSSTLCAVCSDSCTSAASYTCFRSWWATEKLWYQSPEPSHKIHRWACMRSITWCRHFNVTRWIQLTSVRGRCSRVRNGSIQCVKRCFVSLRHKLERWAFPRV